MVGTKSSATVQQMQPLVSSTISSSRTGLLAATLQHLAVDAEIAELVDDQRDAPAIGRRQQVADQRRLAGAQKAGDHRCRNLLRFRMGSFMFPSAPSAGRRR